MKEYVKANKEAYDAYAREMDSLAKYYVEGDEPEIIGPFVSKLKEVTPNPRVLELGPGSGLALELMEKKGVKTSAVELSPEVLRYASKRSPNTEFIKGDFLEACIEENSFDGVLAKAFIHLFPKEDALRVLEKILAVLKPGGVAWIDTSLSENRGEGYYVKEDFNAKKPRYRKWWTRKELSEAVKEKGFRVLEERVLLERLKGKRWACVLCKKPVTG